MAWDIPKVSNVPNCATELIGSSNMRVEAARDSSCGAGGREGEDSTAVAKRNAA